MNETPVRLRIASTAQREVEARAANEAVWIALHLASQAGWTDVVDQLIVIKGITAERLRAIEGEA